MRYIKLVLILILLTLTCKLSAVEVDDINNIIKTNKVNNISLKMNELINNSTNKQSTITNVLYNVNKKCSKKTFNRCLKAIIKENNDIAPFITKEAVKIDIKNQKSIVKAAFDAAPEQKDNIIIELQDLPQVNVNFGKDAYGNPAPAVGPNQIAPVTQGTTPERRHPVKFYTGK